MVKIDDVFTAISSTKRIKALELISLGEKPTSIARDIGISGAGLNRYLESFMATRLVEKNENGYSILPFGKKVLDEVRNFEKNVLSLIRESNISEKRMEYNRLIEDVKKTRMLSSRSLRELEKIVGKITKT